MCKESHRHTTLLPTLGNTYTLFQDATCVVIAIIFSPDRDEFFVFYKYDGRNYLANEAHQMHARDFALHFSGTFQTIDGDVVDQAAA